MAATDTPPQSDDLTVIVIPADFMASYRNAR